MNIFPKFVPPPASPLTPEEITELKRMYVYLHENMDSLQTALDAAVEAEKDIPKDQRTAISYRFGMSLARSTYIVKHCDLAAGRKTEILSILKQVEDLELQLVEEAQNLGPKIDQAMLAEITPKSLAELEAVVQVDSVPVSKFYVEYAQIRCQKYNPTWSEFKDTYKVAKEVVGEIEPI